MTIPRTLVEAFQQTAAAVPEKIALRTPADDSGVTWREYAAAVERIASGMRALGLERGGTVALMLTNRPEFHQVDTAVLHAGGTPFSIYNTLAVEQMIYVLSDAGSKIIVTEEQFLPRVLAAQPKTPIEHVVCVDGSPEGAVSLDALEPDPDFDFEASWRAVEPDDLLTIIYTSGTTGPPKGVELTHASVLATVAGSVENQEVSTDDRVISYLPDAHAANRWGAHWTSLVTGLQITTVDDPKKILDALTTVRPTSFGAVPQLWYKMKGAIEASLAAEPSRLKRAIGAWAFRAATRKVRAEGRGRTAPLTVRIEAALADRIVMSKIRARLGLDQVRVAVSGAAPIAPEALEFVMALGIPTCEVWGMSETGGPATMNPPDAIRLGTVGMVAKGGEIKLAEDGELLFRGPQVMRGYRHAPDKTAETIDDDGWLHTGDLAEIDDDGYVRIVDRKKELIINDAGKNMSPANIENNLKVACPLVGSAVAIGDNRKYVVALITLDRDAAVAVAGEKDASVLAEDPAIVAAVTAGVREANEKLSRVEQIKNHVILPTFWEPGGDELTPTMKLRRKPIQEKYAAEIEALY